MSDLLTQPAVDLLALLSERKISALELADLHITQIERLNPSLNALVDFDPERVRQQARASDSQKGERGLLQGLPLTIKSSISVANHRCETGSLRNRNHTPTRDAETVRRLRAAGAIILGTTNCPENLMAYETDNLLYGRTNNPWNLAYTAGGSSGGESAAIAAGLSAGGLGSDGGGSVRTPAHMTGICALKPTPGRIPGDGHLPTNTGPFTLLGTIGPMARTVADLDILYRVLTGPDDTDPIAPPIEYRRIAPKSVQEIRIGYLEDDGLIPITSETRKAVQTAVESLRSQGFHVEPFQSPLLEAARKLWYKLFVGCGAMLLEPESPEEEAQLSPTFRDFLTIAHRDARPSADELLHTWTEIDPLRTRLLEEMRTFPILLTPACAIPAFRHAERSWTIDGQPLAYLDAMRFTQWFNLLGSPAAVVPITQSPDNLPIGVQLAGRPYADELVLAIAASLDRDFGYTAPPVTSH